MFIICYFLLVFKGSRVREGSSCPRGTWRPGSPSGSPPPAGILFIVYDLLFILLSTIYFAMLILFIVYLPPPAGIRHSLFSIHHLSFTIYLFVYH